MAGSLELGFDGWSARAADGCDARVARDGAALRFDSCSPAPARGRSRAAKWRSRCRRTGW